MGKKYTTNQIRILLALHKGRMSRTKFTIRFRALTLTERYQLLEDLIKDGLVNAEEKPTPTSTHVPIVYALSESGLAWVESYIRDLDH